MKFNPFNKGGKKNCNTIVESSSEECAICLGAMNASEGEALFTAECSHTFHFNCISSNVQHGNHTCPTCRAIWKSLPSQFTPTHPPTSHPRLYADDDPIPPPSAVDPTTPSSAPQNDGKMTVKALSEYPALRKSYQSNSFPVLISIRAPPLSPEASDRAPIDLVAVLDVSGSMNGEKIRLLKQAVRFVADNLSPTDRLSVIPFANAAWRLTPLRSMTSAGKSDTFRAINSLRANGGTNIISGLKLAVQVLEQRREKNPVSSIILLSDGHDNQNGNGSNFVDSLCDLPPCLRANDSQTDTVPVYTFGFGTDHDAAALHAVADGSGGTFSYIESIEVIQDAFARCIGGLLSVVSQEVEIDLKTVSDGVQIQSISSGRYRNKIDSDKLHGMIYVGEVYAEEEKKFLAYLSITPVYMQTKTTQLLKVKCRYKDPLSNHNQYIMSDIVSLQIRRPLHEDLTEEEKKVNLEVDRERNRVSITEGISEAQAMAERGDLWMARAMLQQRRKTLMQSASALAGDEFCQRLESEVNEIHERMSSMPEYEAGGRAYTFSRQSSHTTQRASTQAITPQMMPQVRPHTAPVGAMEFQTSNMTMLVFKSQEMLNIGNRDDKAGASSSKSTKR